MASIVWDERYRTLGDIIPLIEKEVVTFGQMWEKLGNRLALCAACPVFDRCYRIAEWNLQRKQAASKI